MTTTSDSTFTLKEIETLLLKAIQKVNASSLREICHYIPSEDGFRIHHFTLQKFKKRQPEKFKALLKEFVLDQETPKKIEAKPRQQYAKSQKPEINLKTAEIQELIKLAKESNRHDLVEKLRTGLPFNKIKREMLKCIQKERIDLSLWDQYVDSIQSRSA